MSTILDQLFQLRDEEYIAFQSKLIPNIGRDQWIGVRVPLLRRMAKRLAGTPEAIDFLSSLPHRYYDENMLHAQLLSLCSDFEACLASIDNFLPYVDNWAVCDTIRPKVFASHKTQLWIPIQGWISSPLEYTCRFGIEMLMLYGLDEAFDPLFLERVAQIDRDEYYVKMMQAWFFATALAKRWDETVPLIRDGHLSSWVYDKTIQKAIESDRIADEQKKYLGTLRRERRKNT